MRLPSPYHDIDFVISPQFRYVIQYCDFDDGFIAFWLLNERATLGVHDMPVNTFREAVAEIFEHFSVKSRFPLYNPPKYDERD